MKWILIVLITSVWDGQYIDHKQIASYNSQKECVRVQERLNLAKQTSNYLCANEEIK